MKIELESFDSREVFPVRQFLYYLHLFEDGFFVVLNSSGFVVGYAILAYTPSLGYVLSIAVHPKSRKQGYASELLDLMESKCRARGISNIRLDVRMNNIAAIGLYKKLGLTELRIKKNFYGEGHHALSMGKPVGAKL